MKITILGAGIEGLVCAGELLRLGHEVTLVERHAHIGGRARSLTLGGRPFNLGPRAIYIGGHFHRALRRAGVEPRGFKPALDGSGALWRGDLVSLPGGLAGLLRVPWLDARAKRELALAFAQIAIGRFSIRDNESTGAWIDRHSSTNSGRALLRGLARVSSYRVEPTLPADVGLRQMRSAAVRGVIYTDGDWQPLVDGLRADLERRGIEIVVGARTAARSGTILEAFPPTDAASVTASCLDVVLARLPDPRRRLVLGLDEPLYLSVHTSRNSAGSAGVHVMGYGAATRDRLEAVLDRVQPGWRDVLLGARYLPRMVVDHEVPGRGLLADGAAESGYRKARALAASSERPAVAA
jgi:phytoene dehydrogenase-like protein